MSASVQVLGKRGKLVENVVLWLGGLIALWFIGSIAMTIFTGIAALVAAAVCYLVVIFGWPQISNKTAMFFMSRLISDIHESPVIARRVQEDVERKAMAAEEEAIKRFSASVMVFERNLKKVSPDSETYNDLSEQLGAFKTELGLRYTLLEERQMALETYIRKTEEIDVAWQAIEASKDVDKHSVAKRQGDTLARLVNDESIKAVEHGLAQCRSRTLHLSRMAEQRKIRVGMTLKDLDVIDIPQIETKGKVQ